MRSSLRKASPPRRRSLAALTARFVLLAIATAFASAPSCSRTKDTQIVLSDDKGVRSMAAWIEFDVLPSCPDAWNDATTAAQSFADGSYLSGAIQTQIVPGDGELAPVGNLSPQSYGFAAILREADCSVFAFGCTTANLAQDRTVDISVDPVVAIADGGEVIVPLSPCMAPMTCQEGRCAAPTEDGGMDGDGTGGSGGSDGGPKDVGGPGCDMALIAHAPLPKPAGTGDSIAGPGVVATSSGFLVGYEDVSMTGAQAIVTILPLDVNGTLGTPQSTPVTGCQNAMFGAGFGMALNGANGLAAMARPPCAADLAFDGGTNGAGLSFVPFDATGAPGGETILRGSQDFPAINLTSQHALTPIQGANAFRIVYTQDSGGMTFAYSFTISGTSASQAFNEIFSGLGGSSFAVASSTNQVLAEVADVSVDGGTQTAVKITPIASDPSMTMPVFLPPVSAAAVTSLADKTYLATRDAMGTVSWTLLDSTGKPTATASLPAGSYKGFDVATVSDRVVLVAGESFGLRAMWTKGASTKPGAMPEGTTTFDPKTISELASFDGSQLAIAGGNGRVVVAWASRNQLGASDPTGGVAVFHCEM